MKNAVIVGSGIAGIVSAKILSDQGYKIKIIEASNNIGGLMSSKIYNNYYFDHGPHLIQETEKKVINNDLFKNFKKYCHSYKSLPQDSYFNGKWSKSNSFANLTNFNKKTFNKIFKEIIQSQSKKKIKFKNAQKYYEYYYGSTLTNKLIKPLVKKYTGYNLKELKAEIGSLFNLKRFIIASPQITRKLKKNSNLNNVLGFNNYHEGVSGRKNFYPKSGGINNILNILIKNKKKKIKILTNCSVQFLKKENDKIKYLCLSNGKKIYVDKLIWTGGINILSSLLNFKIKKIKKINKYMYWNFFHYTTNNSIRKKVFYSYNYEKNIPIYRITYYDNFQKKNNHKNKFRMTVEVITPKKKDLVKLDGQIKDSLSKMNILTKKNKINLVDSYDIPYAFEKNLNEKNPAFNKIKNLNLFGQAVNKFSKEEIIKHIFKTLVYSTKSK